VSRAKGALEKQSPQLERSTIAAKFGLKTRIVVLACEVLCIALIALLSLPLVTLRCLFLAGLPSVAFERSIFSFLTRQLVSVQHTSG
jgi:hypothetical protein